MPFCVQIIRKNRTARLPAGKERLMRTAEEINRELRVGWNLGNTFDSFDMHRDGRKGTGETGWGNPVTSRALIHKLVSDGFNIIRVPVTWQDHCSPEGDWAIDPSFLDRVAEVVSWILAEGAFAIVNTHHENRWLFNDPGTAEAEKRHHFQRIWEQVALKFRDAPDTLLLEGLNEPRYEGGENEWNGAVPEVRRKVNELEEIFVKTVRKTGGNNEKRVLLVTSAAACPAEVAQKDIRLPEHFDPYLMVSLHSYKPTSFTGLSGDFSPESAVWDGSRVPEIEALYESFDRIIQSKGYPVLVTEDGAMCKSNEPAMAAWERDTARIGKRYGIRHIWWDNGEHERIGDNFAMIDRRTCTWYFPELMKAIFDK